MATHNQTLYIGDTVDHQRREPVEGEYVTFMEEEYYRIKNYDALPPFFMSIVSDSDHWLYISSTGGLSAGRINPDSALFPYYTEDRISENSENTGSKTIILLKRQDKTTLWEPLSSRFSGVYQIQRNLYKNVYGNILLFEEINHDLQATFRYAWRTSDRYGFVKTAWLKNDGQEPCAVMILDGIQNILPSGATRQVQSTFSVLLDAYKRNELDKSSGLGIFALSSTLTDLAEPSESLKATTVWQVGLDHEHYLLSSTQVDQFRHGVAIEEENDVRGVRGAFFVNDQVDLAVAAEKEWQIVADVNQDSSQIAALINHLKWNKSELRSLVGADIEKGTENLVAIVASADGLQTSGDRLGTAHHVANVLFNTMRGGIFADQYTVSKTDLLNFIETRNGPVRNLFEKFFTNLPDTIQVKDLINRAADEGSADLERLCYEYLPLTFSRRHGDPSRPWNLFSINLKKEDGSKNFDYQGNWRDIFQNWEALVYSYPEFVESLICKFLNATTADGYNPYRVTRNGLEWEKPEPGNPWANIGYWSDHQIIYLQKLMEISEKFHPGKLQQMLNHNIFSYANVPYKIKAYTSLLADWYTTIDFDRAQDHEIEETVKTMGTDGKLLLDEHGYMLHVNLSEKLLVLLLAKLSNFVPEGGIWMNTQRPEWNDANNALVGKGLSMVTVYYVRRFIAFLIKLFQECESIRLTLTKEVMVLFKAVHGILERYRPLLETSWDDRQRRVVMDELGQAGSKYRLQHYQHGFTGDVEPIYTDTIIAFLETALEYVEHTIRANKRPDDLYHAYNILHLGDDTASVSYLSEMLEGQVAVLSSGMLAAKEALDVLQALRTSQMYRADQHSYILYPDRDLPGFLAKNCLDAEQIKNSKLIAKLVAHNDRTLIARDENGVYHFNGTFRNAKDVKKALETLKKRGLYADLIDSESAIILQLFEKVFDHRSFTGRSGTFFAYEGLGSIYWHMVSKLLLATQEAYLRAVETGETPAIITQLADAYYDIRSGLGFNKTPDVYGAFPTDPYSHTPAGKGVRQPGMTGQVKEEILTRLFELGVLVKDGTITFQPMLLREQEFTKYPQLFMYIDVTGKKQEIALEAGSLAYTFCQVPVVYKACSVNKIDIAFSDGKWLAVEGNSLDAEMSQQIFQRNGHIKQITVMF